MLGSFKGADGTSVNSVTGLADQDYIGQKGTKYEGQVISKEAIKDLWDAVSTETKNKMDERARHTFQAYDAPFGPSPGVVKDGIFSVRRNDDGTAKGGKDAQGNFEIGDNTFDQRLDHMVNALMENDDSAQVVMDWHKNQGAMFDALGNIDEDQLAIASRSLTTAYETMISKATTTIVSFGGNSPRVGGGGSSNLIGSDTRFNGDNVRKDANPELLKKYLKNLVPIAADTKKIRKMMKGDLRSKEEEFEARRALRRHQAFAGPQRPGGPGSGAPGGGIGLLGALGMGAVVSGGVGIVKRTAQWLKGKMKAFYKYAGKNTQTVLKAAVASKSLSKIKYLFAASLNPIGIAIMGALWAFESVALDYLAEVIAEVDAEALGLPQNPIGSEMTTKPKRQRGANNTDAEAIKLNTNLYGHKGRLNKLNEKAAKEQLIEDAQTIIDANRPTSVIQRMPFDAAAAAPVVQNINKDSGNIVTNNNVTVYNDKMTPAEAKIVDDYLNRVAE
jgi:hypothetical protein